MHLGRAFNIICILLGGGIALYAQAEKNQNRYVLILGIILLMVGVYRTSKNIPGKQDMENDISNADNETE